MSVSRRGGVPRGWRRAVVIPVALLCLFLLAGCGALESHVTIYKREKWKAELSLTLTKLEVEMTGGAAAVERVRSVCVRS